MLKNTLDTYLLEPTTLLIGTLFMNMHVRITTCTKLIKHILSLRGSSLAVRLRSSYRS